MLPGLTSLSGEEAQMMPIFSFPAARTNSLADLLTLAETSSFPDTSSLFLHQPNSVRLLQPVDSFLSQNNTDNISNQVQRVSLQFSLWYPIYHQKVLEDEGETLILALLVTLRDFRCVQDDLVLLSRTSMRSGTEVDQRTLCDTSGSWTEEVAESPFINETLQSDEDGSPTQLALGTMMYAKRGERDLEWLRWDIFYQIRQFGAFGADSGEDEHQSLSPADRRSRLQTSLQEGLNEEIKQGRLDVLLQDYLESSMPTFSVQGDEVETFELRYQEREERLDYSTQGRNLRYLGIALLVPLVAVFVFVTCKARNHGLREEDKELLPKKPGRRASSPLGRDIEVGNGERTQSKDPRRGDQDDVMLETEDDVNHMLMLGRMQAMRGYSKTEKTKKRRPQSRAAPTDSEYLHG